jgi:fructokinase
MLNNYKPKVYCIGEALLDIIFENNQPSHATPGGSMLNTAVSLGRAGVPVHLISDYANDRTGIFISDFLEQNGVSTRYVNRYNNGKTALALAFLDQNHNADYTFYKDYPPIRFPLQLPEIQQGDIILFGSIYSITPGLHHEIIAFIKKAREQGAFVIYDPNFRRPHLADLEQFKPRMLENIRNADMVRGSNEDFELIFGAGNIEQAFTHVTSNGCNVLIYTKNKDGVEAIFGNKRFNVEVKEIEPVSTIGAGDAFNAGLIYGLQTKSTCENSMLDEESLLRVAVSFSEDVCMHLENYISHDFAFNLLKESDNQ